ncbi:MAG: POTRA domain-containing protein [Melioribacteraceae bacterium]
MKILLFVLIVIPFSCVNAQSEKTVIDSIKILGNDITEDFIILRELSFNLGDAIDAKELDFNKDRIFSLGLFTNVDLKIEKNDYYNRLIITVEEGWYIYPIPFISRGNQKTNHYSYGVNLEIKNFRGRNEFLKAIFSIGYDPFFAIYYDNPSLIYEKGLGVKCGISYLNSTNKNIKAEQFYGKGFDFKNYGGNLTIYKRLDQFNTIELKSSFYYIEYPRDINNQITASRNSVDRILGVGIGYEHDSRDLIQFPKRGYYLYTDFVHKGFGINDINYNVINVDSRNYFHFSNFFIGKIRNYFRLTSNTVPFFDFSYLGFSEIIRGRKDEQREGNNLIKTSAEIALPLVNEWNFRIKLPLIPESLTSGRVAVFISLFADAGDVFNNNQKIMISDFSTGYGLGFTFLFMPYNTIRLEYSLGQKNKGEFSIDTGISF